MPNVSGVVTVEGVDIAFDDRPGSGAALVLLHGFLGSGRAMRPLVDALGAPGRRIITIDLVGHGRSDAPAEPAAYSMDRVVTQVATVLDSLLAPDETVDLFGYSMGGRVALATALARPDRIRRLVLLGATAGIDDPVERAARRASDEELASFAEAHGIDAFVDRWEQVPIFATQRRLPAEVRERIRRGRLAQRVVGVANSLRGTGTGSMPPLWDRLATLDRPTLVLAGALDTKYVEVGTRMVESLTAARFAPIPDAGHAAHTERPDATATVIGDFLAEADPSGAPVSRPGAVSGDDHGGGEPRALRDGAAPERDR